ncbi:MAG: hypothetical protein OXI16_13360 [Chloroflexota bacterium]|nr:hypothetical protein [Chloroflexota bacterium]
MSRFKDHPLLWMDIIEGFADKSDFQHYHNARGLIGRLNDKGAKFWLPDSQEFRKWQTYCSALLTFLNNVRVRRDVKEQSLETAMRDFIHEFEHSNYRIHQLLYSAVDDVNIDEDAKETLNLLSLVFQTATYTLVSTWNEDLRTRDSIATHIKLFHPGSRTEGERKGIKVKKEYRKKGYYKGKS